MPSGPETTALFSTLLPAMPAVDSMQTDSSLDQASPPHKCSRIDGPSSRNSIQDSEPALPFPPVNAGSGQKPGEHWKAFFARCEARNIIRAEKESPKETQSRLQRETNARSAGCPGKKGPCVYYWEAINGHRIRQAIDRGDVENYWETNACFGRFDSFANEWDLCSEFGGDTTTVPSRATRWDYDDDDDDFGLPIMMDGRADLNDHNFVNAVKTTTNKQLIDLHTSFDSDFVFRYDTFISRDNSDINFVPAHKRVQTLAYLRYGYMHFVRHLPPTTMERRSLYRILGFGSNEPAAMPEADNVWEVLWDFYVNLGTMNRTDKRYIHWDLCSTSITNIHTWPFEFQLLSPSNDRDQRYIIRPFDANKLSFLLFNPLDVLELLRRKLPSYNAHNICNHLVQWCKPFRVLHHLSKADESCYRSLPTPILTFSKGLGPRPEGYTADSIDYAAYVEARNTLLSTYRSYVALQYGTLIARLTLEANSSPDLNVLLDPSVMTSHPQLLHFSGTCYAYHELTVEEEELIYGVYHVDTGKLYLLRFT
jgi:hypothetical protein